MLRQLVVEELRRRNISLREAGRQAGVAHTTIVRLMDDSQNYRMSTVEKVADWLGVSTSDLVGNSTSEQLMTFLDKHPALRMALDEALEKYRLEEVPYNVIEDILNYITYRLRVS